MRSKKRLLQDSKLYLILDAQVNSYNQLIEIAKKSVKYGIDVVQLRDKEGTAKEILQLSRRLLKITKNKIPFIVNDRVDIAKLCNADGVHVGQDDIPLLEVRRLLGKKAIVGTSCQTMAQVKKAVKEGADYIGFGSVFKTLTKPERAPMEMKRLKEVFSKTDIPVFAIGGITHGSLSGIKNIGVDRVAVCRDICLSNDFKKVVQMYKNLLG